MKRKKKSRVIAYVDGYNLYFGLKAMKWRRFYWLDIAKLCRGLLRDDQELVLVKYFTARITSPEDKRQRQAAFFKALEASGGVRAFYGRYKNSPFRCPHCQQVIDRQSEKRSDVSLAVEMLSDAHNNQFGMALLISGDTDFCPLVKAVLRTYKHTRVVVCFPPLRHNRELEKECSAFLDIGRAHLSKAQFPDSIKKPDGHILQRPREWTKEHQDALDATAREQSQLKGGLDGISRY